MLVLTMLLSCKTFMVHPHDLDASFIHMFTLNSGLSLFGAGFGLVWDENLAIKILFVFTEAIMILIATSWASLKVTMAALSQPPSSSQTKKNKPVEESSSVTPKKNKKSGNATSNEKKKKKKTGNATPPSSPATPRSSKRERRAPETFKADFSSVWSKANPYSQEEEERAPVKRSRTPPPSTKRQPEEKKKRRSSSSSSRKKATTTKPSLPSNPRSSKRESRAPTTFKADFSSVWSKTNPY
jgi:hypothetical protein